MKILVLSDSHGNTQPMLDAVSDEDPRLILHLGDHSRDCAALLEAYPRIPLRSVRGNCDGRAGEPDWDEFVIEGKRIFMTHGHLYGGKTGRGRVLNAAFLREADILLFGHTHTPFQATDEGLLVVNPGSVGMGKRTYAVLELEHGAVGCKIVEGKR
jgi:putative phosphoesterase